MWQLDLFMITMCLILFCIAFIWFIQHIKRNEAKEIADLNRNNQDINNQGFDDEAG